MSGFVRNSKDRFSHDMAHIMHSSKSKELELLYFVFKIYLLNVVCLAYLKTTYLCI